MVKVEFIIRGTPESLEAKRKKWLRKLQGDVNPPKDPRIKVLRRRISQIIKEKGSIQLIEGIYGDQDHCNAYEEEVIKTKDGTFTKILGNTYLLEGFVDKKIIDHITTVKRVWMEDLKLASKSPFRYFLPFIFNKKAIKDLIFRYGRIHEAYLSKLVLPFNDFSNPIKEFIKAGRKVAEIIPEENEDVNCSYYLYRHYVNEIVDCWAMILAFDNAYLFPWQDIFGELNKENLKNPRNEIKRLMNLGISRAVHIKEKLRILARVVNFLLYFKRFRKLAVEFLLTLDIDKIKMSEAAWYYSLKREGYNYRGISLEERVKERERIDREKGHIILPI